MFRKNNVISFCIALLAGLIFFIPSNTLLADSIIEGTSGDCQESGDCTLNDFVGLFSNYFVLILSFVGSLALIMFIYGGVVMVISSGNSEKVTQGKQILISAVIGILIVFSSYMIIQFALKSLGVVDDEGTFINTDLDNSKWDEAPD